SGPAAAVRDGGVGAPRHLGLPEGLGGGGGRRSGVTTGKVLRSAGAKEPGEHGRWRPRRTPARRTTAATALALASPLPTARRHPRKRGGEPPGVKGLTRRCSGRVTGEGRPEARAAKLAAWHLPRPGGSPWPRGF